MGAGGPQRFPQPSARPSSPSPTFSPVAQDVPGGGRPRGGWQTLEAQSRQFHVVLSDEASIACEMAPNTMMDYANQEWGLVMLTSCPRCQHTFQSPCCGPCCPSYPAQHAACPTTVGPIRCTTSAHTSAISLSGGYFSARNQLTPGSCCGGPRSPDPSPSLPLSFVLPSPPINPKPHVPLALHNASDLDLQRLSVTLRYLKSSGWYYEGLTWQESITLLAPTPPGTFLVRESSNPSYLFSLSVQAEKGPTSVRIHYINGYFRLDAEPSILPAVPLFDCVVKMIEYYIYTSQEPKPNRDLVSGYPSLL
ncbi:hypothetical protein GE061_005628 [Apolygus lucorum]|uniref:SH2 domain-containing protein n=1 Tax=Apolygus lucorum TaxID=248454 RepID=A0A8S9WYK6_APOLU|nr:hypothetical protein GE061_005628 [Apolygus lucorum]